MNRFGGHRDPDFLREPPHEIAVRAPTAADPNFQRRTWGRRQFMAADGSVPFFPGSQSTATLIDTPSFAYPVPLGIRVRFAEALGLGSTPNPPPGRFQDFLPSNASYTLRFRLSVALDPLGPFADQDIDLVTAVPPVPPSFDSPVQDRWPIQDIHAAQLRLTVECLSTPLWVEGWCAPIDTMTRPGLRGDVSDLGPGYPGALLTQLSASDTSQVILAANERRTQFIVANESDTDMVLAFAPVATSAAWTVRVPGNASGVTFHYESFVPAYRGVVSALHMGELPLGTILVTEGFI